MKAFLLIGALLLAALPAAAATTPSATATATLTIHIHDFTFDPNTVTVAPGTTIEWDNDDGARHTVTASDGSFDSGDLKPGMKWSHTFTAPGTIAYGCTQHPEMQATVIVKAP